MKSLASDVISNNVEVRREVSASDLYQLLRNGLKKVQIDGEELYIAEGDTLLDEDQLGLYARQREAEVAAARAMGNADQAGLGLVAIENADAGRLIGITRSRRLVRWADGEVLTYRIAKSTFSAANYELVTNLMAAATKDWEDTCGVSFEHHSDLDDRPDTTNGGVVFTVREIAAGGAFIAAAFFPTDPVHRRRVLIDPSFYSTSFDQTGVLRHELGHVLGFRHEHIRSAAPPACKDESLFDTRNLTEYDPQSVMHYFCGDVGSRDLAITDIDRRGARKVYGLPLSHYYFVQ